MTNRTWAPMTALALLRAQRCLLALCMLVLGQWANAQDTTVYLEQGQLVRANKNIKALGNDLMGDKVGLYTGSLEFSHTDVSLPGNNALPVSVGRRYETAGRRAFAIEGLFSDWELEIPRLHGTYASGASYFKGWVVPASTNLGMAQNLLCTNFGPPPDASSTKVPGASLE